MHQMTEAQLNHLRRLLGWMRCEVGQTPEEQRETMRIVAQALTEYPNTEAQVRIMERYDRGASIPKYIRAAIKALTPLVREQIGEIVEAKVECDHKWGPASKHRPTVTQRTCRKCGCEETTYPSMLPRPNKLLR